MPTDDAGSRHITVGILLAFFSYSLFSISDASVKEIHGGLPPYESAFFGAVFAVLVVPMLLRPGDRLGDIFAAEDRRLWLLRFFCYPIGVIGSVIAFTHLSMAETFALIFLQPIFVTILSATILNEHVDTRRWITVVLGFAGVLIATRPGFHSLSIGHLGAIVAGLCGSVTVISFRASGWKEKRISLFGAGILGGLIVCGLVMAPHFQEPTARQWMWLAAYGLLAAAANVITMLAAVRAPAAILGPTQYIQMVWGVVLGYLLFQDRVDAAMIVGIVLIAASGLMTLARSRPPLASDISH